MNHLICLYVLVSVKLQWLQHCSIFTSFCEDFWLPAFRLLAHILLKILRLLLRGSLGGMRQAGFTFAMQGYTLALLHACLSQEKELGICKRIKNSELDTAIRKLCSYSEGKMINRIQKTGYYCYVSPNESSFVVLTWQLWRLINNK